MALELCLYNIEQVGILLLDASGPTYFHLTGPDGAWRVDASGYLVPMSNDAPLDIPELALLPRLNHMLAGRYPFTAQDASALDQLMMEFSCSDRFVVDRQRLSDSRQSWIYLTVYPGGDFSAFGGSSPMGAVLVWPSSTAG